MYSDFDYSHLAENAEAQSLEHLSSEFNRVSARLIAVCWSVAGLLVCGLIAFCVWGGK